MEREGQRKEREACALSPYPSSMRREEGKDFLFCFASCTKKVCTKDSKEGMQCRPSSQEVAV